MIDDSSVEERMGNYPLKHMSQKPGFVSSRTFFLIKNRVFFEIQMKPFFNYSFTEYLMNIHRPHILQMPV